MRVHADAMNAETHRGSSVLGWTAIGFLVLVILVETLVLTTMALLIAVPLAIAVPLVVVVAVVLIALYARRA